jgi:hypothetical protein
LVETVIEEEAKRHITFNNKPNEMWDFILFKPHKATELPNGFKYRNVELEQFGDVPWLVAELRRTKICNQ